MIEVKVEGFVEVIQKFETASASLIPLVEQAVKRIGAQVVNSVKGDYLSGRALNARTGALRSSVTGTTSTTGNEVTFHLTADTPYAAIYERGGTIPAYTVRPKTASALRFISGGSEVFAKYASIPARRVEPRPYLRPALDDAAPDFAQAIEAAISKELK